jgi:hypothetical protein
MSESLGRQTTIREGQDQGMKVVEPQMANTNVLRDKLSRLSVTWNRVGLYVVLCLSSFLLGMVPMWLKANRAIEQRDAAQREVRVRQLQNTLGNAIVDVQQGDYEPARQTMSDFYTNLRRLLDTRNENMFTAAQREQLRLLLQDRDAVITLLARSDETAGDRLSTLYTTYLDLTTTG